MSIEKKSLISSLKTTKKANVASGPAATNDGSVTRKVKVSKADFRRTMKVSKAAMAIDKMR